jgi:hypothetical protein
MEKEICTISITSNWLGDEYTFYENEKIKRTYDNNSLSSDVTEWLEPKQISKHNSKNSNNSNITTQNPNNSSNGISNDSSSSSNSNTSSNSSSNRGIDGGSSK